MIGTALSLATGLFSLIKGGTSSIAKETGVDEGIVSKVVNAVEAYTTKDERAQKFLAEQMELARQHDIATFDKDNVYVNALRSSVRPLVTFSAMGWYLYARVNGIELLEEDYAIIGGVLAFWFGFRPFDKRKK